MRQALTYSLTALYLEVPGSILNRVEHPGIGALQIKLSNGMRVLYKAMPMLAIKTYHYHDE